MAKREPTPTTTMKLTDARQNFSAVLNQVSRSQTRVVVEKNGIPVAAIVAPRDLEHLRQWEDRRAEDFAILDEIGAAFRDQTPEQIEREVVRALAAAREQARRKAKPLSHTPKQ